MSDKAVCLRVSLVYMLSLADLIPFITYVGFLFDEEVDT
jgi:hypothetical protein